MKNLVMNFESKSLSLIWFLCVTLGGVFISCGDDDKEEGVTTVDSYYGASIDTSFFFHPEFSRLGIFSDDVVAEIGPVNGLDEITSIPQYGWYEKLATREGYGYVVHNKSYNRYSKVYIKKKTEERTIAEYQCPFVP